MTPLNRDLDGILRAMHQWVEAQPSPEEGSRDWYALNNFRTFIEAVEADPSAEGIEKACHALTWHIVDQYDDADDCWKQVSTFNERIRRIGKEMARQQSKHPSRPD